MARLEKGNINLLTLDAERRCNENLRSRAGGRGNVKKPHFSNMPPGAIRRGAIAGCNAKMLTKRVPEQMDAIFDEILPNVQGLRLAPLALREKQRLGRREPSAIKRRQKKQEKVDIQP